MRLHLAIALATATLAASLSSAGTLSVSPTTPIPGPKDILQSQSDGASFGQFGQPNFYTDAGVGQFFKTGVTAGAISSIAFQIADPGVPSSSFTFGIYTTALEYGTSGGTIINRGTPIATDTASRNGIGFVTNSWLTLTFDAPVTLAPNTEYGVLLRGASSGYTAIGYKATDVYSYSGGLSTGAAFTDRNQYPSGYVDQGAGDAAFYIGFTNAAAEATWSGTSSGNYSSSSNWLNGNVPANAPDAVANFSAQIASGTRTVFSDTDITLGTLRFLSANTYQLVGTNLTLSNSSSGSIVVQAGTPKINLPTTFASSTSIDVASGSTLLLSDPVTLAPGVTVTKNGPGALTFQSTLAASAPATLKLNTGGPVSFEAGFNSPNINVIVDPATLNLANNHTLGALTLDLGGNTLNVGRNASGLSTPASLTATSLIVSHGTDNTLNTTLQGNSATFNAITIDAASSLTKTGPGTLATPVITSDGTVTVSAGTLRLTPGNHASYLASLSVTPGATLDLTNNTLVWLDGNLSSIRADVVAGRLSSSSVNPNTTLAVFLNDAGDGATPYYSSYGSVTDLIASDVIVRYTYKGDLNLDGKVDGTDLATALEAYSTGIGSGWNFGDVNYDNLINTADISIILNQINANLPSLGFPTGGTGGNSSVPEPTAIAMILPALAITARKRR